MISNKIGSKNLTISDLWVTSVLITEDIPSCLKYFHSCLPTPTNCIWQTLLLTPSKSGAITWLTLAMEMRAEHYFWATEHRAGLFSGSFPCKHVSITGWPSLLALRDQQVEQSSPQTLLPQHGHRWWAEINIAIQAALIWGLFITAKYLGCPY